LNNHREFLECNECKKQTGFSVLCSICIHNRTLAEDLNRANLANTNLIKKLMKFKPKVKKKNKKDNCSLAGYCEYCGLYDCGRSKNPDLKH